MGLMGPDLLEATNRPENQRPGKPPAVAIDGVIVNRALRHDVREVEHNRIALQDVPADWVAMDNRDPSRSW